ncbi:MAG: class I SAM-dependent methyltransferase [Chlorobiaceae bacterium]|jgi:SAM-dependent methyltransferase|nr:class I SAM-dependent methyltransferase [Chlorobiaceae bacterium]
MADSYYSRVNRDLLDAIPLAAAFVLEIGCGTGSLARAYRTRNPGADYFGVEIVEEVAREAVPYLTHTVVGDIGSAETRSAIDNVRGNRLFDVLILGDVIEHLPDPWSVLSELRNRMTEGGTGVACIPNVSHWSVLLQQLHGRWDYTDEGLLDRTHLRFFTLETAIQLFRQSGWSVLDVGARTMMPEKTDDVIKVFLPLAKTFGINPEKLRRDLSAYQWVIRFSSTPSVSRAAADNND